ncbi:MAG: hypothetical protein HFJ22_07280 [Clostridia bacterium]|nr:hypothetical protein [Clostridia bacterium]
MVTAVYKQTTAIITACRMPKSGKGYIMAWFGKNRRGKDVCLLNPSEKGAKFACELKTNVAHTNFGQPKVDESGNFKQLTKEQRAYRSGYLSAQKDSANCYKAKMRKGKYLPVGSSQK